MAKACSSPPQCRGAGTSIPFSEVARKGRQGRRTASPGRLPPRGRAHGRVTWLLSRCWERSRPRPRLSRVNAGSRSAPETALCLCFGKSVIKFANLIGAGGKGRDPRVCLTLSAFGESLGAAGAGSGAHRRSPGLGCPVPRRQLLRAKRTTGTAGEGSAAPGRSAPSRAEPASLRCPPRSPPLRAGCRPRTGPSAARSRAPRVPP